VDGNPAVGTKRAEVPAELDGERADRITSILAGVSREVARRLVEEGAATFDGRVVSPHARLTAGLWLEVRMPPDPPRLAPEDVSFRVQYEDRDLAVVDKPAGLVVHPGAGRATGTLAAGIIKRWPATVGVGDEDRWGIVHRLDRDTSGLMVVALTGEALKGLRRDVARRALERTYLALVHGDPGAGRGTVDAPLARDPRARGRFRVDPQGRSARTHYRLLAWWEGPRLALLEVGLETGRTHQIRVHLASIGHPVVSDPVYGHPDYLARRQFLHASRLRFSHPVTGEGVDVASPLPEDLAAVIEGLGPPQRGSLPDFSKAGRAEAG
jgi:23S rRNA pseudouridine1911/1915/1917 synthase